MQNLCAEKDGKSLAEKSSGEGQEGFLTGKVGELQPESTFPKLLLSHIP